MRTRIIITAILLLASLAICSIPAICQDNAAPAPAPAVAPAAPAEPAAPAVPPADVAPAVPAAPAPAPASAVPAAPAPVPVNPPVPAPAPVAVAPLVIPPVTPDTDIFKRTVKIDGVVEDGEWDTFYTVKSGDLELTTYADWDSTNLYFAAKCNKPIDFLAILDANADGWYNGEDNYEFRGIRGEADAVKLTVDRYDSRHTKTATASAIALDEAALITLKSGTASDGAKCIEMSIPAGLIPRFKLGSGRRMGLLLSARTGSDEASWIASGSPGDVRESTLVTKKIAALKPLVLGFDLLDPKVARGEDIVGKFHITNSGADMIDIRSFVIAGEGKSSEYLSSEKIRMEGLAPKKHIAHEVRSVIPKDMPLGSWALGAEVKSADGKLGGALVSFEVVEPFEISLKLPDKPVLTSAKEVTLGVVVTNNVRREVRGVAMVTLPSGWELWKIDNKREFRASSEQLTTVTFKTKPPLGVLGDIPVKFDVTINGKTVSAEGKFVMINPAEAK